MDMRYEGEELYVMVADVKNPKRDRRCAGMLSKEVFEKGLLVMVETRVMDYTEDYPEITDESKLVKHVRAIRFAREISGLKIDEAHQPELFNEMMAAIRPVRPSATKVIHEKNLQSWSLSLIIKALIQEGYLSLQAFEKMAERIHDDDFDSDAVEANDQLPVEDTK